MPIHIEVKINDRTIKNVHIARMEPFDAVTENYSYRVVQRSGLTHREINYDEGIEFMHRYLGGLDACIARAFEALEI